jgi:hypothetical protein
MPSAAQGAGPSDEQPGEQAGPKKNGQHMGEATQGQQPGPSGATAGKPDQQGSSMEGGKKQGNAAESAPEPSGPNGNGPKKQKSEKSAQGKEGKAGTQAETKQPGGAQSDQAESGPKGEQSKTEASAKIESKDVDRVRQHFSQNKTELSSVTKVEKSAVSVSVGVAVPQTITLYTLPPDIVIHVRTGCEVKYFLWGPDLVLVDSCSHRVLEIITNIA